MSHFEFIKIERELATFSTWRIPVFYVLVAVDGVVYRVGRLFWSGLD